VIDCRPGDPSGANTAAPNRGSSGDCLFLVCVDIVRPDPYLGWVARAALGRRGLLLHEPRGRWKPPSTRWCNGGGNLGTRPFRPQNKRSKSVTLQFLSKATALMTRQTVGMQPVPTTCGAPGDSQVGLSRLQKFGVCITSFYAAATSQVISAVDRRADCQE
jgi:hypothetical protein